MRALLPGQVITVKVIELQKSLLDAWKFFRPFLNTLTADEKYSLISKEEWMETIQMHLSQKRKILLNFFLRFSNLHLISNLFKERWPS